MEHWSLWPSSFLPASGLRLGTLSGSFLGWTVEEETWHESGIPVIQVSGDWI